MQRSKASQAQEIVKYMQSQLKFLERELTGVLRDEVMEAIMRPYTGRLADKLAELREIYGIKE